MMADMKIHFISSSTEAAATAAETLSERYGHVPVREAEVIVALGGDGLMLNVMHQNRGLPVYGMNRGTVGFLMNAYSAENLTDRIAAAEETENNPLAMTAGTTDGHEHCALAINEVSLLRAGPQAARLRLSVNGRVRMEELVSDGALLCTPAGSTAYNYSAGGPILPLGSAMLALTPISPFRPRRWRGAILPDKTRIGIRILDPAKRPVSAAARTSGASASSASAGYGRRDRRPAAVPRSRRDRAPSAATPGVSLRRR